MKGIKIFSFIFFVIVLIAGAIFFLLNVKNTIIYKEINNTVSTTTVDADDLSILSNKISIIIGGDVMFDRSIRSRGEKNGYGHFFDSLKSFFVDANLVVVNLEGPITGNSSKTLKADGSYGQDLQFTFATSTATVLKNVGIDIVSLANNHTDNFGYSGYMETKSWLSMNGVNYFGSPWNSTSTEVVFEINGIKVAFVGYHYFQKGLDRILGDIKRLDSEGYLVIVMPHWGEEYETEHLPIMEEIAQRFILAGADAIIGSHPHVVMDHTWIGDVPVFYSLGNLLFDQYFSPEVKRGNIVRLNLEQVDLAAKIESVEIWDVFDSSKDGIKFDEASSTVEVI